MRTRLYGITYLKQINKIHHSDNFKSHIFIWILLVPLSTTNSGCPWSDHQFIATHFQQRSFWSPWEKVKVVQMCDLRQLSGEARNGCGILQSLVYRYTTRNTLLFLCLCFQIFSPQTHKYHGVIIVIIITILLSCTLLLLTAQSCRIKLRHSFHSYSSVSSVRGLTNWETSVSKMAG